MNISAKRSPEAPHALRRVVIYVVVISSIVSSLVTLFYLYDRQVSPICFSEQVKPAIDVQPPPPCGSSPADATLAGCLFDHMNLAWQVPACHNAKLIRTFSVTNPDGSSLSAGISGSSDASRALPLSAVEASQTALLYVSREFLRRQCKFRWTELTQALVSGGPVHSMLRDERWTLQCEDVLLDEEAEKSARLVPVVVAYPECVF
jgi:hypothetical protein